jgi:hypothetical protein
MTTKRHAPCEIDVAEQIQQDIMDCDDEACNEIGADLEALQNDPLPADRQKTKTGFFYHQLACGYFVAWEIRGDLMKLVETGDCTGTLVKILGVGRAAPK